jgi:transposase
LFAAMSVATGGVLTDLQKRHAATDVLRLLKHIDASVPRGLSVHVVLDNLSAHSAPQIARLLAHRDRRRWHLHFTPTSSSWLNLIERWFKKLTDKRLRRGRFTSVPELTDAITTWASTGTSTPSRSSGRPPPRTSSPKSNAAAKHSTRSNQRRTTRL